MLRANGGQDIFFLDKDRYRWSLVMQEGVERYGHRSHGFCLMTNHGQLAAQVGQRPLSEIIQNFPFLVYSLGELASAPLRSDCGRRGDLAALHNNLA